MSQSKIIKPNETDNTIVKWKKLKKIQRTKYYTGNQTFSTTNSINHENKLWCKWELGSSFYTRDTLGDNAWQDLMINGIR